MEGFESEGKSVGLIFDISIRHAADGRRIVDTLKKKFIDVFRELMEDDVDSMYLYHPELVETLTLHGDQISAIGNFDTDGWKFNLSYALKQTLYVLLAEDLTYRKYVIYVTDRIADVKPLEKAVYLNHKEMLDAHFILIGVGDFYDSEALANLAQNSNMTYIHLNDPSELNSSLFKENVNVPEDKDLQIKTDERCERLQFASGHCSAVPRSVRSCDAIDGQPFSTDSEQLLSTDSCGRLFSESGVHCDCETECTEECRQVEAAERCEGDPQ